MGVITISVLDLQVGASADDVRHYILISNGSHGFDTTFQLLSGNTTVVKGTGAGMRFTSVTIAQGSTWDVAYLTLTANAGYSGATCIAVIDAEDVDTGTAPTSDADYDDEVKTTATAPWNPIPAAVLDTAYNTPSIIAVGQEITDRAGWASGGALQFFLHDDAQASSSGAYRTWYSYDQSTTKAPKLHIESSAGGGAVFVPTLMVI